MSDDRYTFWTHGVNLVVQDEPDPADSIRRNSQGTRVRQSRGENWFHFGVTTPSMLDDHKVRYTHAYLKGYVNEAAEILNINVYEGGYIHGRDISDNLIWPRGSAQEEYARSLRAISGDRPLEELNIGLSDWTSNAPIVICINARFDPGGEIYFAGAGISFKEY